MDGLLQRLGYNFSSKQAKKQFFINLLGRPGAEFVTKGITGLPGTPIDVAGRLGFGNIIPMTGLFQQKRDHGRDVMEIAGPAGDLFNRVIDAADKVSEGDIFGKRGAVATVMPTAVRNALQGADMAQTDTYRDKKGYKVIDTTLGEAIAKGMGFQPRSVDRVQEASWEVQKAKAQFNLAAASIRADWAKAIYEHDAEGIADARERIADWNRKNPEMRMSANMPAIMRRVKEMRKSKDQRISDTAPKAIRERVRQHLQDELQ